MLLKEIAKAWRKQELMQHALEVLGQMISDAEYVFTHAWEACLGQAVLDATAKPIREHDKNVNRGEREVRRILVEHLTINPGQDVAGCLALMTMAKDTERLGDHGRNIFAMAIKTDGKVRNYRFCPQLDEVHKRIQPLFQKLHDAVLRSDEKLTHEVLAGYQTNKNMIKNLQTQVLDSDLQGLEAMATILLVRYFKRTNGHLGNIASGIIFPIENIDYVSRGLRQEQKQGWAMTDAPKETDDTPAAQKS
jgi:phosphate transport system protein